MIRSAVDSKRWRFHGSKNRSHIRVELRFNFRGYEGFAILGAEDEVD